MAGGLRVVRPETKKMSSIEGRQIPGAEIMPSVQNKQQQLRADYKGLEATLHDPKKKYQEKVNALLSAWERVVFLTDKSPDHVDELTENIHRDTLHIVLQGEWPGLAAATKTHLLHILSRCAASKHPCAPNYQSLIEIVKEPWGQSTFKRIIAGEEPSIEEVISYCNSESSTLLNMRLQILTSSKCEDIALRLARICVRCLKIPGSRLHEECSTEHKNELIDFYVALLYKFKLYTEIIEEVLMGMTLEEGMDLARRHVDNGLGPSTSRLWKHSIKIGLLEVRFFLKVAVKQTETTCSDTLIQLALMWGALHQKAKTSYESLAEQIKGLVHQSDDTGHIYIICSSLHELLGDDFRALFIELIIHGLTTDMNDLEKQKLVNMNVKAGEAARRISLGFEHLSKLFVNNVGVSRECILNAFSLYPTKELYSKIKELAVICGKAVPPEQSNEERYISVDELCKNCKNYENNSSNENNAENAASSPNVNSVSDSTLMGVSVAHSSENKNNISCDNTAPPNMAMRPNSPIASCSKSQESNFPCQGIVCSKCGTITVANTSGSSGNTPGNAITESLNQVFDAQRLGVSSDVCDDLAVILGCPRWQLLSWNLEWNELSSLCEKYLNDPEGTRSVIKELKYLDIDYDQFKNYPTVEIDEYYGIEKGYEHLLNYEQYGEEEEEEDESEIPKPKGRRKAVDSDFEDYVPNQTNQKKKRKKKNVLVDTSNSKAGLTVTKTKQTGVRGRNKRGTTGRGRGKRGMRALKYKNMRGSNTGKTLEVPPFNNGASRGSRGKGPGTVGRGRGRGRGRGGRGGRSAFQSNIVPEFEVEQNGVLGNKTGDPEILKTLLMFRPGNCNSSNKNVSDSIINDASSSDKQCNGFQMEDPHILPPQSPVSKNEATVNDPHNIFSAIPGMKAYNFIQPETMNTVVNVVQVSRSESPVPSTSQNTPPPTGVTSSNIQHVAPRSRPRILPGQMPNIYVNRFRAIRRYNQNSLMVLPNFGIHPYEEYQEPCRVPSRLPFEDLEPSSDSETTGNPMFRIQNRQRRRRSSAPAGGFIRPEILLLPGYPEFDTRFSNPVSNDSETLPSAVLNFNIFMISRSSRFSPSSAITHATTPAPVTPRPTSLISLPSMFHLPLIPPRPIQLQNVLQVVQSQQQQVHYSLQTQQITQTMSLNSDDQPKTEQARTEHAKVEQIKTETTNTTRTPSLPAQTAQRIAAAQRIQQPGLANLAGSVAGPSRSGNVSTPVKQVSPNKRASSQGLPKFQQAFGKTVPVYQADPSTPIIQPGASITKPAQPQNIAANLAANLQPRTFTTLTKLPIGAVKSLIHGSPGRLLIAQAVPQRLPQNLNQASTSGLGQMAQQVTLPGFRAAPPGTRLQATILTSAAQVTPEEAARMQQEITKVLMRAKESAAQAQAAQAAKTAQANKTAAATATSPNVANQASRMVSVGTTTNSPSIPKSGIDAIDSSSEESTDSGSPAINHLTSNSIPNLVSAVPTPAQRAAVQTNIIRRIPLPLDGNNRLLRTPQGIIVTGTMSTPTAQLQQPQQQQHTAVSNDPPLMSPTNTNIEASVLEQLREFESVLEHVTNTSQMKERKSQSGETNGAQQNLIRNPSTNLNLTVTSGTPTVGPTLQFTSRSASTFSPEVFIAANSGASSSTNSTNTTAQQVSLTYVSQASSLTPSGTSVTSARLASNIPVVVVTSYSQSVASPALSVTSQSSSSPCVTPAPNSGPSGSAGKTIASKTVKTSKPKTVKTTVATSTKTAPVTKPQQKPQEDEQTVQRIYAILGEYAEQLRNSPDLNNKPAPRRRSNPPTNPTQSSKRKKSSSKSKGSGQGADMSPSGDDMQPGSDEDSSSGMAPPSSDRASPACQSGEELDDPPSTEPEKPETTESSSSEVSASTPTCASTPVTVGTAVTPNTPVLTGKPVVGSNTTQIPCVFPASVRQVLLGQLGTVGQLGTIQRQPLVVGKGQKLIRVQVSNNPLNAQHGIKVLQGIPGTAGSAPAALLLHQMCMNKALGAAGPQLLGQSVRQVKLPMGTIPSHALSGVSAQPPVVLPPGTHAVTNSFSGLAHTLGFADSTSHSEGPTAIITEPTLLLKTATPANLTGHMIASSTQTSTATSTITKHSQTVTSSTANNQSIKDVDTKHTITSNIEDKNAQHNISLQCYSGEFDAIKPEANKIEKVETKNSCGAVEKKDDVPALVIAKLDQEKKSCEKATATSSTLCVVRKPVHTETTLDAKLHGEDLAVLKVGSALQIELKPVSEPKPGTYTLTLESPSEIQYGHDGKVGSTRQSSSEAATKSTGTSSLTINPVGVSTNKGGKLTAVTGMATTRSTTSAGSTTAASNVVGTSSLKATTTNVPIKVNLTASNPTAIGPIAFQSISSTDSKDCKSDIPSTLEITRLCDLPRLMQFHSNEDAQFALRMLPVSKRLSLVKASSTSTPQPSTIASSSQVSQAQKPTDIYTKGNSTVNVQPSPATYSGLKRTYSNLKDNEYHSYRPSNKAPKKIVEQRMADTNLEQKLRQEAMEKELRLQKSLSEECEDLGVDEPSTSDLFPEADLLLDPHPGLNFDSNAADASCSQNVDSNDPFPCSDLRSVDSTSNSLEGLQYVVPSDSPATTIMHHQNKYENLRNRPERTDSASKYSGCPKRYSGLKSNALRSGSPSCTDTNGSKLLPCAHPSQFSSSSGDESLNIAPCNLDDHTLPSPIPETYESTKSQDSQDKSPFTMHKVSHTYGKKSHKSTEGKRNSREDPSQQQQQQQGSGEMVSSSRPFASVSKAPKSGSEMACTSGDRDSSLDYPDKHADCSANGTDTTDIPSPNLADEDTKESSEEEVPRHCTRSRKRKSEEALHEGCHPRKRRTRLSRSLSDENVLGDDEGGDMDESTQESQTQERKSVPVACSSDSNWSASPDISESSPLSVDMKSGGECGQRTSSRRSSQRGKVQRSTCSCCNGSPEPKKSRNAKVLKKGTNGKLVSNKSQQLMKKR